jgi:hypothetical protein
VSESKSCRWRIRRTRRARCSPSTSLTTLDRNDRTRRPSLSFFPSSARESPYRNLGHRVRRILQRQLFDRRPVEVRRRVRTRIGRRGQPVLRDALPSPRLIATTGHAVPRFLSSPRQPGSRLIGTSDPPSAADPPATTLRPQASRGSTPRSDSHRSARSANAASNLDWPAVEELSLEDPPHSAGAMLAQHFPHHCGAGRANLRTTKGSTSSRNE